MDVNSFNYKGIEKLKFHNKSLISLLATTNKIIVAQKSLLKEISVEIIKDDSDKNAETKVTTIKVLLSKFKEIEADIEEYIKAVYDKAKLSDAESEKLQASGGPEKKDDEKRGGEKEAKRNTITKLI